MTDKDGACVLHPAQICAGVDRQVLGRETVRERVRFFGICGDERYRMRAQRLMRDRIVFVPAA